MSNLILVVSSASEPVRNRRTYVIVPLRCAPLSGNSQFRNVSTERTPPPPKVTRRLKLTQGECRTGFGLRNRRGHACRSSKEQTHAMLFVLLQCRRHLAGAGARVRKL